MVAYVVACSHQNIWSLQVSAPERQKYVSHVEGISSKTFVKEIHFRFFNDIQTNLWCQLTITSLVVVAYTDTVLTLHTDMSTQMWRNIMGDCEVLGSSNTSVIIYRCLHTFWPLLHFCSGINHSDCHFEILLTQEHFQIKNNARPLQKSATSRRRCPYI